MAPPTPPQKSSNKPSKRRQTRRRSNPTSGSPAPPPPPSPLHIAHLQPSESSTRSGFSSGSLDFLLGIGVGMRVPTPAPHDSCAAELERMAANITEPVFPSEAEGRGAEVLRLIEPFLPQDTTPEERVALRKGAVTVERVAFIIVMLAAPLISYVWIAWMLHQLENGISLLNRLVVIMLVIALLGLPHYRIVIEAWKRYMN